MVDPLSERRMVENEVVFRQYNEKTKNALDELSKIASDEGDTSLTLDPATELHFYCECADENCRGRIVMRIDEYEKHHIERNQFIVIPGHEFTEIERIIYKQPRYYVVQKRLDPPQRAKKLHSTSIDNV